MTAHPMTTADACARRPPQSAEPVPAGVALGVRLEVRLVGREAGRALAAAQGAGHLRPCSQPWARQR